MANPPDSNHVLPTSTHPPVSPPGFPQMPLQPHRHGQTMMPTAQRPTDGHYDRTPLMQTVQEQERLLFIQEQVVARRRQLEQAQTAQLQQLQYFIHQQNQTNFHLQQQQNAPGSGFPLTMNRFPLNHWPPVPLTPQPVQNLYWGLQQQNHFPQTHPGIHPISIGNVNVLQTAPESAGRSQREHERKMEREMNRIKKQEMRAAKEKAEMDSCLQTLQDAAKEIIALQQAQPHVPPPQLPCTTVIKTRKARAEKYGNIVKKFHQLTDPSVAIVVQSFIKLSNEAVAYMMSPMERQLYNGETSPRPVPLFYEYGLYYFLKLFVNIPISLFHLLSQPDYAQWELAKANRDNRKVICPLFPTLQEIATKMDDIKRDLSQMTPEKRKEYNQPNQTRILDETFESLRQCYEKYNQMAQAPWFVYMYFYVSQLLGMEMKDSITEFVDQLRELLPELPQQFYTDLAQNIQMFMDTHPNQPK